MSLCLADIISTNSIHIDERLGEAKTTLSKCTKMEKVFACINIDE